MACLQCNDEGFWCDVCGNPESDCNCFDDPETGGPNFIECDECAEEDK